MAIVVLELDEEFQVAIARALVEAPQCALVATADPNSRDGHIAVADTYEEALRYAQEHLARGWHAVVWEVPNRRDAR
jgi:predicted acyltransferase